MSLEDVSILISAHIITHITAVSYTHLDVYKRQHILCSQGLNIEYMYALASANRRAMIVKASDGETAARAVTDGGLVLYSNEEMCW